jgi:hypothetical protein
MKRPHMCLFDGNKCEVTISAAGPEGIQTGKIWGVGEAVEYEDGGEFVNSITVVDLA